MSEGDLNVKYDKLKADLATYPSLLVAFSGGADSTFLLAVARKAVPGRVLAVIGSSPSFAKLELEHAEATAELIGAEYKVVATHELNDSAYTANPPDRCYYCKLHLMQSFLAVAQEEGLAAVAEGTTTDELEGHRPGARAIAELGVLSPLAGAGLHKDDVRALARKYNIPNFDRPAMACLASRFPVNVEITVERLKVLEEAEALLADLGFRFYRCRWHGELARIELGPKEMARAALPEVRRRIVAKLHSLGFTFVTLDLDGYRVGSMAAAPKKLVGVDKDPPS